MTDSTPIDVDALLAPFDDTDGEGSVGPDLSYDPERQAIEDAFERSVSDDAGTGDNDWPRVVALVADQAARTKDIWLGIYMMRGGARGGDMMAVEAGSAYLAGLFERWWATVHPTLDDYGFQGRKGPCESLTRVAEFLGPLRRATLIAHPRLGSYTADDFERFREEGDAADGYGMFRAALAETPDDVLREEIGRLDRIRANVGRVDAVLTAEAGDDTGTNFAATYATLDAMRRGLATYAKADPIEAGNQEPAESTTAPAPTRNAAGTIDSREDVTRAIEAICDYYRRREPGSPVPMALRRAAEWVDLDFLAVLADIAPEASAEARRVLSFRRAESEDSSFGD